MRTEKKFLNLLLIKNLTSAIKVYHHYEKKIKEKKKIFIKKIKKVL